MKHVKVSFRYAKALFDTVKKENIVDKTLEDMLVIKNALEKKSDLYKLMQNPTINHIKKSDVIHKIFSSKIQNITMNFLTLVTRKGRESVLTEIIEQYLKLYHEEKGIVLAEVVSAKPISLEMKEEIKKKINIDGRVELKELIDPSILGGLIINSGGIQYDASVRKKINNVKRAFKL